MASCSELSPVRDLSTLGILNLGNSSAPAAEVAGQQCMQSMQILLLVC